MSELTPAQQTAMAADRIILFGAVEINLPGYDLCLCDGSAVFSFGGKTFRGRDPIYGVLDTIKGLSDKKDEQAPAFTLGLIPAGDAALSDLVDPAVQGSQVVISVGTINPATGQPTPDPYAVLYGELDVPTVKWGANDRRLEYRGGTVADRLFNIEEGRRLSSAFHTKVWPGELGMDFVTDIETVVPWGESYTTSGLEVRSNLTGYIETFNRT
jgi:hypothetical protein